VFYLLLMDVERLLHEGRSPTPDHIKAMLCAGASLRDDPVLNCVRHRMTMRMLASRRVARILGLGLLSDGECSDLIGLLEAERKEDLLLPALRGERACKHRLYENLTTGKASLAEVWANRYGPDTPTRGERLGCFLYSFRVPADYAAYLTRINEGCEIAQLPVEKQMAAWVLFDADVRAVRLADSPGWYRLITSECLRAIEKVWESSLDDRINLACAITALAAERFRLANERWPTTLQELCPKYLPAVPSDPFTGKPLLLSKREDGIVIYSVAWDGKDDGGQIEIRQRGGSSADYGFRLYDADKRNLPSEAPNDANKDQEP
jgi:hypothetical protein